MPWQVKRYHESGQTHFITFSCYRRRALLHACEAKRGLCARPEDWEWSSYRHYATGASAIVEIESECIGRRRERAGISLMSLRELPPYSSQNGA